jgi:cytochrome P450
MGDAVPRIDELDLPVFGLDRFTTGGDGFHADLESLAAEHRFARIDPIGYAVLARDDVDAVLRTRHASMPALQILELQGVTDGPVHRYLSGNLLNLEGQVHRDRRRLVSAAFSPARANELRPAMRAHVTELFAAVAPRGRCEFVADVAKPYPARMIAEIVGAPVGDAPRLEVWAYWIQSALDPTKLTTELANIERAAQEFEEYVAGLLTTPADTATGVLATVLPAVETGELTDEQAASLIAAVLVGGVDTTQAQLAHAVRLFAEHPGQWAALVADPGLVRAAVDEVLRFEPIAPFTARLVTEEFASGDVLFPTGTLLIGCASTANRDPSVYDQPSVFDITVDRGDHPPLSFGAGPHFCIGHALARAELEEALTHLATRVAALSLDGAPRFDSPSGIYGLLELPIAFTLREHA